MADYQVDYELIAPCCGDRPGRYRLPGKTLAEVLELLVDVENGRVRALTITQEPADG